MNSSYIDICMVCSPDRYIPALVMDHLFAQNIPFRLFMSNSVGSGAADARNLVKEMWQSSDNDAKSNYILATDNDIIHPIGSIKAMIKFLEDNPSFGAIGLHRNMVPSKVLEDNHVNAGPVLYRSEVYSQISYHNRSGCECQGMTNDIKDLDYRIGYLDGWQYDHVEMTRRSDYEKR